MPSSNYYHQQQPSRMQQAPVTGHVDIPDSLIGFAIGKHGGTLNAIQTRSGAKMQVSSKGEFVSGTENRRVTITGSPTAVQMAEVMLQTKLREIREFQNKGVK